MTSNLLYLLNDAVLDSVTVTPSSEAAGYDADNLVTGWRGDYWKSDGADAYHTIRYQVGAGDGLINAFFLAGLNWHALETDLPTIRVRYSSDGSTYTNLLATTAVTLAGLIGPQSKDYVYYSASSGATSSTVYWQLIIGDSGASPDFTGYLNKWYAGEAFDPGRDPAEMTVKKIKSSVYERSPRLEVRLQYYDIANSKAQTMLDYICERADYHPIVIFTRSDHDALHGYKCLHCELIDFNAPQIVTDRNDFELVLREIL